MTASEPWFDRRRSGRQLAAILWRSVDATEWTVAFRDVYGRFLETVGTYNPICKPAEVKLFEDRLTYWLNQGATPSDTVSSLFTQVGFTEKYQRAQKGEDVSELILTSTITERRKKTRKMKKASVAAEEETPAETTEPEQPSETSESGDETEESKEEQ